MIINLFSSRNLIYSFEDRLTPWDLFVDNRGDGIK